MILKQSNETLITRFGYLLTSCVLFWADYIGEKVCGRRTFTNCQIVRPTFAGCKREVWKEVVLN